jgi:hypothetical protein
MLTNSCRSVSNLGLMEILSSIAPFIIPQCFEITHGAYVSGCFNNTDGLQVNSFYHGTNTIQYTECYKKGLHALMGYTTHLNEQKSPSQRKSRNQCLLRYGQCSCDSYSRCSMWFPCISIQLSALCCTQVHTL